MKIERFARSEATPMPSAVTQPRPPMRWRASSRLDHRLGSANRAVGLPTASQMLPIEAYARRISGKIHCFPKARRRRALDTRSRGPRSADAGSGSSKRCIQARPDIAPQLSQEDAGTIRSRGAGLFRGRERVPDTTQTSRLAGMTHQPMTLLTNDASDITPQRLASSIPIPKILPNFRDQLQDLTGCTLDRGSMRQPRGGHVSRGTVLAMVASIAAINWLALGAAQRAMWQRYEDNI
jgi:hypothetical protein